MQTGINDKSAVSTVDAKEISNFTELSSQWWDESGAFGILHKMLPCRMRYIRNILSNNNIMDRKNIDVLDIGCGGGLTSECLARMGMNVTGVDADENAIRVASDHAQKQNLQIQYIHGSTDTMDKTRKYDVITALEIVEHVDDIDRFVKECLSLCKENGIVIFSTLNQTFSSYVLGILAAENVLGWVPKGTHSWKKFVKPSRLAQVIRQYDGKVTDVSGVIFNVFTHEFELSKHQTRINYFLTAQKN